MATRILNKPIQPGQASMAVNGVRFAVEIELFSDIVTDVMQALDNMGR